MSKLDGMMSRNEERAWEAWENDVAALVAVIRAACDAVEASVRHSRDSADILGVTTGRIEDAANALWKIRHGPERED